MTSLGIDNPKRRESDSGLADAPWPVRAIVVIGATTAIALYLVYFLANDVRGYQQRTEPVIHKHVESTNAIGSTLQAIEQGHQRSNRVIERILRQMCLQQAKSREERERCDPAE